MKIKEKIVLKENRFQEQIEMVKKKEWPAEEAYNRLMRFLGSKKEIDYRPFYDIITKTSHISTNETISGNSIEDKESMNNSNTEYEEKLYDAIKGLSIEMRSINSMKDISELFALSPEINQYVQSEQSE